MRKIVWICLAALLLAWPAGAEAISGYVMEAETRTYQTVTLALAEDAAPGEVLAALCAARGWDLHLRALTVRDGLATIDLQKDSYPLTGADKQTEYAALSSLARTVMENAAACRAVRFTVEGAAYPGQDDPFLTDKRLYAIRHYLDRDVYNPNIDAATGAYVDPLEELDEDAPIDDQPHVSAPAGLDADDPFALQNAAFSAYDLLELMVNCGDEGLVGRPEADFAWRAIALYYGRYAEGEETLLPGDISYAYDALFAYGRVPSQGGEGLKREGDAYVLTPRQEAAWRTPSINSATLSSAGEISVDISVISRSARGVETFLYNATATILLDEGAPFGAKIAGITHNENEPFFTGVSATEELPSGGNISYAPENTLDDSPDTCWAYHGSAVNASITFTVSSAQTVRGLCLLPFYAKNETSFSANDRVKTLRVTLSDGNIFEKTFPEDFSSIDQWVSMAFEGAHRVTWIQLEVLDVYPGGTFRDTCISEVRFF